MKLVTIKPFKQPRKGNQHSSKAIKTTKLYHEGKFVGLVDDLTGQLYTKNGSLSLPGTVAHEVRRKAANDAGISVSHYVELREARHLKRKNGETE